MWQDTILNEIHKIREEHAESFNYDLDAMFVDWQQKQSAGGREVVSLAAKPSFKKHWPTPAEGEYPGESIENIKKYRKYQRD